MAQDNQTEVAEEVLADEPTVLEPAKPLGAEWPRDPFAFTSSLRRELDRAIRRVQGNDEKAAIVLDHLREAARWLNSRVEVQKALKEQAFAEVAAREAAQLAVNAAKDEAAGPAETREQARKRQEAAGVGR